MGFWRGLILVLEGFGMDLRGDLDGFRGVLEGFRGVLEEF